jgi:hypothetical protein
MSDIVKVENHANVGTQTNIYINNMPGNIVLPTTSADETVDASVVGSSDWIVPYLEKAVAEYGKMRTSFFDKTAKDFYSFYLHSDLKKSGQLVPSVDAAKLYALSSRVIISASGGFGKSTLMRHLLLSAIDKYNELRLLPVFVRLGDYVCSDTEDISDFVLEQANLFGAEIRKEQLVSLLVNGGCLLLFDGLDEISPKEIKRIDYKLRPFFAKYANNTIVMTTRPYPIHKLNSLGKFETMDLQPLKYKQAVELARKREEHFSQGIGSKFSDVLTPQLFQKHESMMRNPKLLTVMLKTYSRLNIIPDKLHVLYREVVKSLSELYDEESENANRMLKTRLAVREILRVFAAVCYKAYENDEYDFTEQTIDRYIRQTDKDIDADDFLFDVCENLCFIEASGGKYRFFHRSMQEYFCAQHLIQLSPEQLNGFKTVLKTRSQDYNESVLSLLFEMNPDMVEEHIFLPFLTELFGKSKKHTGYANYLFDQYPLIYYDYEEPLEESENQPLAPLLQYLRVMLGAPYKYSTNDFPFYEEFAVWVTVMPIFSFGEDDTVSINLISEYVANGSPLPESIELCSDKADEVMPPERIPFSSYNPDDGDTVYEEVGWELEFKPQEVYATYENDGKYAPLVEILENDEFEFKSEYLAAFDYYERLKTRFSS